MSSNDMSVLLEAAKTHLGIALLSNYVALPEIRKGSVVVPLPDFPVPDLWIKAMVPIDRLRMPEVEKPILVAFCMALDEPDKLLCRCHI